MAPPAPDRFYGKLGGVVIDANTDPTGVGRHIIDPIRNDFAQLFVGKVVDPYRLGFTLRAPLLTTISELTDQLFLR
jgi:hypothetical protein